MYRIIVSTAASLVLLVSAAQAENSMTALCGTQTCKPPDKIPLLGEQQQPQELPHCYSYQRLVFSNDGTPSCVSRR
jgi:hypothetical protein